MQDALGNGIDINSYQVLIDNAAEPVLILDAGIGRFIDSNRHAHHIFKLTEEEFLTKGLLDLSAKMVKDQTLSLDFDRYLQQALNGSNPTFNWNMVDSKGHEIPCEIRLIRYPPFDQQIVRLSVIDRSNQKELEVAFQESEERLKLALEATGSGYFDWYPKEKRLLWDARIHDLFGLLTSAEINRLEYFYSILHPDDRERMGHLIQSFEDKTNPNATFTDEYRIIKEGMVRHIYTNGRVFKNDQKEVLRAIGIVQDITERKQAEEQLRYQAELLENISDAVISTDKDFRIKSWNRSAEKLYHWRAEEVMDQDLVELIPATYPYHNVEEVQRDFWENESWQGEVIQYNKEGEGFYVQASVKAIKASNGDFVGAISVNRNIDEQKQAEIALSISEEKFSKTFHQNPNMMVLADIDTMTILDVNQAYCQRMGFKKEELVDIPGRLGATVNDPNLKTFGLEVLKETGSLRNFEVVITTKNEEQMTGLLFVEPIHIQGQHLHIYNFVDITERKEAEGNLKKTKQELSEITERFETSTKAAKVGIWDWDVTADFLIWDQTMFGLYGIQEADFIPTAGFWQSKLHPDDKKQNREDIIAALKGERDFHTEFRIIWPDQTIHHIKTLGTVQWNEKGRAVRMIGTNWDITKAKEAERQKIRARQLELKNKELEQFAYIASHDLQEPLRTVIGFVGLLKKRKEFNLSATTKEYLEFIAQAATRMNKLINGLLEYSQIGSKKEQDIVDCNALLEQILADLSSQISETQAVIEVGALPQLSGYETELRVLFQNLISNAIKFNRPGIAPNIHISAQKVEDVWQFCITDNGIGIEPQNQDRVFVIFQRLHARNEYGGTGIGLAHCQKIVDLHGGKIWIESQLNVGSSFYFTIPDTIMPIPKG